MENGDEKEEEDQEEEKEEEEQQRQEEEAGGEEGVEKAATLQVMAENGQTLREDTMAHLRAYA